MTALMLALGKRVKIIRYAGVEILGTVTNVHFGMFGIEPRFEVRIDGGAYIRDLSMDEIRDAV